jgi:hypothetical protein
MAVFPEAGGRIWIFSSKVNIYVKKLLIIVVDTRGGRKYRA